MQWSDAPHGGFTTGTPWLRVNPNYPEINASHVTEENSIYAYYRSLISFRKTLDIITEGDFTLLHREDAELFAYVRQEDEEKLTVFCNFSENTRRVDLPEGVRLIGNYEQLEENGQLILRPYEACAFLKKGSTLPKNQV
jgi:oligo-1,6-glucosidase